VASKQKPIVRAIGDGQICQFHVRGGLANAITYCEYDGKPFDILLPIDKVSSYLGVVTGETLDIELLESKIQFKCGSAKLLLGMLEEAATHPKIDSIPDNQFELNGAMLADAIRKTSFAVDLASTRYQLGAVNFEFKHGMLNVVATDGRRLSAIEYTINNMHDGSILIPAPFCQQIASLKLGEAELVRFSFDSNSVQFRFGDCLFQCQQVEGRFPNWRQVIPSTADMVTVPLTVGECIGCIKQVSVTADAETRAVVFLFQAGSVVFKAHSQDGESTSEMVCSHYGDPLEVTLDGKFVLDALSCLEPGQVLDFRIKDTSSPIVLEHDSWTHVIMPMARDR
jgi:DNA polymerase-3 subunit beta